MKDKVFEIIEDVISDLNEELQYESLKKITDDTPVFGGESGIDSLSLAFLISQIEIAISEELGVDVVLADEKAMSMHNSPYRTVGSLDEFILSRIGRSDA